MVRVRTSRVERHGAPTRGVFPWAKDGKPFPNLRLERRAKLIILVSQKTLPVYLSGSFLIPYLWLQKLSYFTLLQDVCSWNVCGALCDLVPCGQFKKREKHPWRSVTFSKVAGSSNTKNNTPPWAFFHIF